MRFLASKFFNRAEATYQTSDLHVQAHLSAQPAPVVSASALQSSVFFIHGVLLKSFYILLLLY